MKNLILSICILASGIAISQDISFTNKEIQPIIFSNNGYYQNGLAYTGKYIVYFENGVIKEELTIKDGKLQGSFVRNHDNGKPMEMGNYDNNLKFGLWTRYSISGNLIAQASYINNKKDGNWFVYNEAGNKLFEMIYKDGEKIGTWNQWDETGKLIQTTNYSAL